MEPRPRKALQPPQPPRDPLLPLRERLPLLQAPQPERLALRLATQVLPLETQRRVLPVQRQEMEQPPDRLGPRPTQQHRELQAQPVRQACLAFLV